MRELYLVPSSWLWVTLQDVAEVITGNTPPTSAPENYGGKIPFIKPPQLNDTPIEWSPETLSEKGLGKARLLPPKSVLVSCIGILGKTAITKTYSATNQQINAVVFEPPLQPEYGFYYAQTLAPWLKEYSSATTVSIINKSKFAAAPFPLPPAVEQTRIVTKLEELLTDLDAGVAELKTAQKKLFQYRQSLLKTAVEGTLTAEWREGNPPTESGTQLLERILLERRTRWEAKQLTKFTEQGKKLPKDWQKKYPEPVQPDTRDLPQLPEGWVWASLDMLGEIASGIAKGSKRASNVIVREVPYLRVANVQRGYLDLMEVKTILATERDIKELTLQDGDVLFNEGGDRDKLGRGWVWRNQVSECIHQNHVFRMRPYIKGVQSELISHHGNTFGKLWFQNAGKQTTNLASINMTILRMFPVPVAPVTEQQEILKQIQVQMEIFSDQELAIELALKQSSVQRQNILRAAFSGQLVAQNPNDEPANVLLERIRAQRAEQIKQPKPRRTKNKKKELSTVTRKLVDVLTEASDWLPAQDAFQLCGIADSAQTEEVEMLYAELRVLDKDKRLLVDVVMDEEGRKIGDRLKLVG